MTNLHALVAPTHIVTHATATLMYNIYFANTLIVELENISIHFPGRFSMHRKHKIFRREPKIVKTGKLQKKNQNTSDLYTISKGGSRRGPGGQDAPPFFVDNFQKSWEHFLKKA